MSNLIGSCDWAKVQMYLQVTITSTLIVYLEVAHLYIYTRKTSLKEEEKEE